MVLTLRCRACDKALSDKDMFYDEIIQDYNDLCYNCRTLTVIEVDGEGEEDETKSD